MGIIKGGFLRIFQTLLYIICFCCSAVVLGIYSYFLSVEADRRADIPTWEKAVEGLSGAATLYTIFAVLLTLCLSGIAAFSIIGFILDICFVGAFIAIAVMTRGGTNCSGPIVNTPLGSGNVNDGAAGFGGSTDGGNDYTYSVRPYTACKLNTAAFAVSIVALVFFIITAFMQLGLIRSHRREKRYGPGPSNGYTSGSPKRRFWQRRNKRVAKDSELGMTGTAPVAAAAAVPVTHNAHSGYHTQPTGTGANSAANPYGYDNTAGQTNTVGHTHNLPGQNYNTTGQNYSTPGQNYTTGTATNY